VHSLDLQEKILPGANGQLDPEEGLVLSASQGEGLRRTMEPGEAQEPVRGGSTVCQTGKNLGSNSGLPQEAEGETDQLPERHSSNCLLG
jgi:hypothetical protein